MEKDRIGCAKEWRTAQAITLTVPNLVTAAKRELNFLARVHLEQGLTRAGPVLDRAIQRYESCWLPLLASQERGARPLVPPLDCAWVWHCHRLNPVRYAQDCKALYRKILGAPDPEARFMEAATETTVQLWKKRFPTEPYHHIGHPHSCEELDARESRIRYDLVDAVLRQRSFYYHVSELHVRTESYLHAAEMRYKGFLHLAAKSKGQRFLSPTYDIDLMWHAHQLDPLAYRIDTLQIVGSVLNHDESDTVGSKLATSFHETKQFWEDTYSLPYAKAGAMSRGEPPIALSKIPIKRERFTSSVYKSEQEAQYGYLTGRESVQMRINILGAKNVPVTPPGARLFVSLRAMKKSTCGEFELKTGELEISEQPRWEEGPWTLRFETVVEGIVLELRMRKPCRWRGGWQKKSKLLGEVHIPFDLLLASPTLSALDWLSLHKKEQIWDLQRKPPALEIAASMTPPVASPYLFRAVTAKVTDDNFQEVTERWQHIQMGRWLTRSVLDHRGNDIYTVRIRKLKGCKAPNGTGQRGCVAVAENERIVDIYRPNRNAKPDGPPITLAASAIQLMDTKEQIEKAKLQRQWALFEPNTILTVKKSRDPDLAEFPLLTLDGSVGYPVALVAGRWLQYQVRDSPAQEERGFVTVVRYTPECPTGKATALFNWKSATIEVSPGESAIFVMLVSILTALAVQDLLGTMRNQPTKTTTTTTTKKKKILLPNTAEWGAVTMECENRGCLAYRDWWSLGSEEWAHENCDLSPQCGGACATGGNCGAGCLSGGFAA